ncbi:hypothetical protein VTL71DRAFT_15017 [Oculimacula yallundae]|uniref:Uncharacterized protein n=1 Tax=Oculimacula yallundae TaxID=86028 RepID=A0ABR4CFD6_9HELO
MALDDLLSGFTRKEGYGDLRPKRTRSWQIFIESPTNTRSTIQPAIQSSNRLTIIISSSTQFQKVPEYIVSKELRYQAEPRQRRNRKKSNRSKCKT